MLNGEGPAIDGPDGAFALVAPPVTVDTMAGRLRGRLADPLPGLVAQLRMAPRPRAGWRQGFVPDTARPAAALILLQPWNGGVALTLTVRSPLLPQHAGQVSLPGGAMEPGETIEEAALREAGEEIGVDPAQVSILGRLSPLHIPVSGFLLHPVIGVSAEHQHLAPTSPEVCRVIDAGVDALAAREHWRLRRWDYEGRTYDVPYFAVDSEEVWGATAMVLAEFLWVVDERLAPDVTEAQR